MSEQQLENSIIKDDSSMSDTNIQSNEEVNTTTTTEKSIADNNLLETTTTNTSATTTTPPAADTSSDSTNSSDPPSTPLADPSSHGSHGVTPHSSKYTSVKDVGISSEKNPRFRRTMEDEHVSIDCFGDVPEQGYFAIYDGHGGRGAVDFTAKTLHINLLDELNKAPNGDVLECIRNSYLTTDSQMSNEPIQFSGTTTISALIRYNENNERMLYVANAGDARAVISCNNVAERLSYDHKGSDADETKRIVDAGGFVVNNRVNGILAVTRSLGDHSMKEYVVGDPYQRCIKLESNHTLLILACDGLWDVVSDQEAINHVLNETEAKKMSDKLLSLALRKGSTDNISIMVIIL
eukprot:gene15598-18532_t